MAVSRPLRARTQDRCALMRGKAKKGLQHSAAIGHYRLEVEAGGQ